MGKGRSEDDSGDRYRSKDRSTIPYNIESPFFQAEGDDLTDLAFFLGQFGEDDGEFSLKEYWSDPERGFQSEDVGPTAGRSIGGAIGERLDDFADSGYNLSVYDFSDKNGYDVTAAVSQDLPRTFGQRVKRLSPEINYSDGGMTVQGNLDISAEELYESARNAGLQETRVWPRVDSALRTPFQAGMK